MLIKAFLLDQDIKSLKLHVIGEKQCFFHNSASSLKHYYLWSFTCNCPIFTFH